MAIDESDWKQFKRIRADALERMSERILDEACSLRDDGTGSAHERYLELYELIRKRDREMGRAFDQYSRSTAMDCLREMARQDLLTDREIAAFSDDVQAVINEFRPVH